MAFEWWPVQKAFTDPKYWHFWDGLVLCCPPIGRGWRWPDASPSRAHGVLDSGMNPTTDWITIKNGAALRFQGGASDHVDCGDDSVLSNYPFTMLACVRRFGTGYQELLSVANSGSSTDWVRLALDSSGKVRLAIHNGSNKGATGTTVVGDGEDAVIAGVAIPGTTRKVYLNGVLETTVTNSHAFPSGLDNTAIGATRDLTPSATNGIVRAAFIWNRALSDAEIMEVSQIDLDWLAFSPQRIVSLPAIGATSLVDGEFGKLVDGGLVR